MVWHVHAPAKAALGKRLRKGVDGAKVLIPDRQCQSLYRIFMRVGKLPPTQASAPPFCPASISGGAITLGEYLLAQDWNSDDLAKEMNQLFGPRQSAQIPSMTIRSKQ
jgi:hypothetical protein